MDGDITFLDLCIYREFVYKLAHSAYSLALLASQSISSPSSAYVE